jgi:hypothetical protein
VRNFSNREQRIRRPPGRRIDQGQIVAEVQPHTIGEGFAWLLRTSPRNARSWAMGCCVRGRLRVPHTGRLGCRSPVKGIVNGLPVDYAGLVRDLSSPLAPAAVGPVLLGAAAGRYRREYPHCSLVQFTRSGATYSFDLASAVGAEHEDRTVAAWAATPAAVARRDVRYQRGFPLAANPGAPVNRDTWSRICPARRSGRRRDTVKHGSPWW